MRPISRVGRAEARDWRERDGMANGGSWTGVGALLLVMVSGMAAPASARNAGEEGAVIEARALDVPFIDTRSVGIGAVEAVAVAAHGVDHGGWGPDGVCAAQSGRLPVNVRIEEALAPRVQRMLERSATFRGQCRRLAAAPWVHVGVRMGPYFLDRQGYRAYSTIQRPQPKLLVAVVTLQASADASLWIGHEFEHLVEQIDEVDVVHLASRLRDAWHTRQGMVETGRAVRVGNRIFDEVRAAVMQDNLVD